MEQERKTPPCPNCHNPHTRKNRLSSVMTGFGVLFQSFWCELCRSLFVVDERSGVEAP
jgi:transposase-like protein